MDEQKLEERAGKAMADFGSGIAVLLIGIGDELGLWRALAEAGPVTSVQLAERTGYAERYLREWLAALAANGYLAYDPQTQTFAVSEEDALILADENSPAFLGGLFASWAPLSRGADRLAHAFRTGEGIGWHEHEWKFHQAQERFTRPFYETSLLDWIAALDGVEEKLSAGARVADVGCGNGVSTVVLARAFPNSTFYGFDYNDASIARARKLAAEAGVADRVIFEVATATEFPGEDYDLVAFLDCFHDFGDPAGAAARALATLKADGTLLLAELNAADRLEDNFNPLGAVFLGTSVLLCVPNALSQNGGTALGNQVGDAKLREIVLGAGFRSFRRASETPVVVILEAKP